MIDKPKRNILLGCIVPPAMIACICVVVLIISMFFSSHVLSIEYWMSSAIINDLLVLAKVSFLLLVFILVISGIQSIIYSLLMNYLVLPKVQLQSHRIWISGLFGGLAGALPGLIGAALDDPNSTELQSISIVLFIIGSAVGLLSGWILSRNYDAHNPKN